jgi:hypothetical protein
MKKMLKLQNMKKRRLKSFRRDWWNSWMKGTSYSICLARYCAVAVILRRYCM